MSMYEGKTFYLCTAGCNAKLDAHLSLWSKEQMRIEAK